MLSMPPYSLLKILAKFVRIGYEGTENMFYFLNNDHGCNTVLINKY